MKSIFSLIGPVLSSVQISCRLSLGYNGSERGNQKCSINVLSCTINETGSSGCIVTGLSMLSCEMYLNPNIFTCLAWLGSKHFSVACFRCSRGVLCVGGRGAGRCAGRLRNYLVEQSAFVYLQQRRLQFPQKNLDDG
jgi:hypothetical protein